METLTGFTSRFFSAWAQSRLGALVWCLALAVFVLAGAASVPLHGDEPTVLYMGRDAYYALEAPALLAYSPQPASPTEQHLRLLNGTLPKYLYGLAARLAGYGIDDLPEQWDWAGDWDYNQQNGAVPDERLLHLARLISSAFLASGVLALFILGQQLHSLPMSYGASALYAVHGAVLLHGRRAMMEGALIAFSLWLLVVGVYALRILSQPRSARQTAWAWLSLSVVSGLALASKHTAVFALVGVWGGIGLYFLGFAWGQWRWMLARYGQMLMAALLALGVFLVLNPAWMPNPIERLGQVLALRQDLLNGQVAFFGGYADWGQRLDGMMRFSFSTTPQYYEVSAWALYLRQAIPAYEASGLAGLNLAGMWSWALLGVSLLGVLALVAHWRSAGLWLVLVWAGTSLFLVLALTPLAWQRYYLPAQLAMLVLCGAGVPAILSILRRFVLFNQMKLPTKGSNE